MPALIIIAGALVYANSLSGVFILDDLRTIERNEVIRTLWPPGPLLATDRPLVTLSCALNYAIGGYDVGGYHVFNIAVHLAAALVLFGLTRRTMERAALPHRAGSGAAWTALAVSLIWVVHPLQTQSVTYIIQRGESMMGLFYLLTLYCVARGALSANPARWYAAAVIACALGMGSKAVMVTAPVVVLLYDRVFLADSIVETLRRRGWLYLSLAATWVILIATGATRFVLPTSPRETATVGFGIAGITPIEYGLSQPGVILHYLRLAFWPDCLCLDYQWAIARAAMAIVLPLIVVGVLAAATLWALRRPGIAGNPRAWVGFCGACFFLILSPTSSFVPIKDLLFEHRMYLPLAAVVVLTVAGVSWCLHVLSRRLNVSDRLRRVITGILLAVVVGALGWTTVARNRDYRSDLAMWQDVVVKRPDNARAHTNLGLAFDDRNRMEEAEARYIEAKRLDPDYFRARYSLARVYKRSGRYEEAVAEYQESRRINPTHLKTLNNLGNALKKIGRLEEALGCFEEAIRLDPGFTIAHYNLGNAHFRRGRFDKAADAYRAATQLAPGAEPPSHYIDAHINLGNSLGELGRHLEAIGVYERAVALDPKRVDARFNMGWMLERAGRTNEAVLQFEGVLLIDPDFTPAREALATLRAQDGGSGGP